MWRSTRLTRSSPDTDCSSFSPSPLSKYSVTPEYNLCLVIRLALKNQNGASAWANQLTQKSLKNTTSAHFLAWFQLGSDCTWLLRYQVHYAWIPVVNTSVCWDNISYRLELQKLTRDPDLDLLLTYSCRYLTPCLQPEAISGGGLCNPSLLVDANMFSI